MKRSETTSDTKITEEERNNWYFLYLKNYVKIQYVVNHPPVPKIIFIFGYGATCLSLLFKMFKILHVKIQEYQMY